MVVTSPYRDREARSFWKTGVERQDWSEGTDLYRPKFPIREDTAVATAGSCFAQHIAREMRQRGFSVLDTEPAPRRMPAAVAQDHGYQLYSARYGNIYTVRQLLQLAWEAVKKRRPPAEVWQKDGRYFDALRPSVEPAGLESPEEVQAHREAHLYAVRRLLKRCELFVFTLGLTEAWVNKETGVVYPTAPGTLAGEYDPEKHAFVNFSVQEIYRDFVAFRNLMKRLNPKVKFLITVSPVPLTATAGEDHVLPATIYSKSVLRSVAGQLSKEFDDIDYFPSYEIVATPFLGQIFYDRNMRTVSQEGVATVMRIFFAQVARTRPKEDEVVDAPRTSDRKVVPPRPGRRKAEDVVCEEVLLDAFAP